MPIIFTVEIIKIINFIFCIMFKNKIFNFTVSAAFIFIVFLTTSSAVSASLTNSTLPDNVKITSTPDTTSIIINSKPGYSTRAEVSCINGKCTQNATSTALTATDIIKIQKEIKQQQDQINKFWELQNELFRQQQQMFQSFWGTSWF